MKTAKVLPFLLILLFSISVFSQDLSDSKKEQPFIEVTGTAEKEIIPDEIFLAISLKERYEGKEKITIEKQEADLKQALMNIGIPIGNLQLADALASYTRVRWSKNDVIAEAQYMLKVWDAATLGKVIEVLDELKIEDAAITKVSHSKIEEYRKEVRIMAIKTAKNKADYLLTAIGEQTGKPIEIHEVMYNPRGYAANVREAQMATAPGELIIGAVSQGIQFQNITLKASIYVKFGIE